MALPVGENAIKDTPTEARLVDDMASVFVDKRRRAIEAACYQC